MVTHGGAGSILDVLKAGKPLVIVPRQKDFMEHIDDHQFQLAKALDEKSVAVVVTHPTSEGMLEAIENATKLTGRMSVDEEIIRYLKSWLRGVSEGK